MQAVLVGSNTRFSFKFILVIIMLFVYISGKFEGITMYLDKILKTICASAGLSLRGRGRGFPPSNFQRKIDEI